MHLHLHDEAPHELCSIRCRNILVLYCRKWSDSSVAYAKNNIELSVHDIDFFVQLVNYASVYKVSYDSRTWLGI